MTGDVERLAEEIIRDVWDDDRHDMWFDASQPPGNRDFGCACNREPLGHIPEDDYEAIERAHRLDLVRERLAAHDAEVAARARTEGRAEGASAMREALTDESRDAVENELRDLWHRALEREGNLASAVADVMWKATQYGETEDGDIYAYIVPKGCMHRLIGVAQSNGAHVPVAFRARADRVAGHSEEAER